MNFRMVSQSIAAIMLLSAMAALADPPPGFRWTQTFNDDFDGTALDATKWKPQFFGCHVINNELQAYQPGNVSVRDGKLYLTARKEQCTYAYCGQPGIVKNYSSGIVISEGKFAQRYGYWEFRMMIPRGYGTWPAFWLLGQNGSGQMAGWPPEIDIVDFVNFAEGPMTEISGNAFCGSSYPSCSGGGAGGCPGAWGRGSPHPPEDMTRTYHNVGVMWTPDSMTWYLDDKRMWWHDDPLKPALIGQTKWECPLFMLINVALNPTLVVKDASLPCTLKVDWVRVWEKTTLPVEVGPGAIAAAPANMRAAALLMGNTLVIPAGAYSLEILDVAGKLVAGESGRGPASRDLTFVKPGAYVLQLCGKGRPTARWIFVRK